jgi:hypothetical protein
MSCTENVLLCYQCTPAAPSDDSVELILETEQSHPRPRSCKLTNVYLLFSYKTMSNDGVPWTTVAPPTILSRFTVTLTDPQFLGRTLGTTGSLDVTGLTVGC